MEFTTNEVVAIEQTSEKASEIQNQEVCDLRLACSGGGNVTVLFG
jgi:hypothetical protein